MANPDVNEEEAQRAIVEHFQKLRKQQQQISQVMTSLDADIREYDNVLNVIREFEPERKCYREVSGTLVCFTAAELVPMMEKIVQNQKDQKELKKKELVEKGIEIDGYRKEHNIRFLSQEEALALQRANGAEAVAQK
uniref:Prefoldin subunit 2 n=1 Tax=Steinernema glaseri TaxID=37863 RepID=A0A1I8AEI7_9BILA